MLKTISLKKIVSMPKLKIKNNGKIYDREWHMSFGSEEKRQQFLKRIAEAEKNIEDGKYYTAEEVEQYFKEKYGI